MNKIWNIWDTRPYVRWAVIVFCKVYFVTFYLNPELSFCSFNENGAWLKSGKHTKKYCNLMFLQLDLFEYKSINVAFVETHSHTRRWNKLVTP